MIQEIASFVNPDLTVEFDPASRVSGHASLKCTSPLCLSPFLSFVRARVLFLSSSFSLPTLVISLSYFVRLFPERILSASFSRASRSLDENKRSNWTGELGTESEGQGEKGEERISRGEEKPNTARGTKRESEERWAEGEEEDAAKEKKEKQCEEQQK